MTEKEYYTKHPKPSENEHFFLSYSNVCCVKCGLNYRYLLYEPKCEKKGIFYEDDDGYNKFITGTQIIMFGKGDIIPIFKSIVQNKLNEKRT